MKKKFKYTFIYPDFEYRIDDDKEIQVGNVKVDKKGGWYNEGIAQLAAIVENENWEVDMIHMLYPYPEEEVIKEIKKRKPDVIGINVRTDVYQYCRKMSSWLKGKADHIMAGSYHASLYPGDVINWEGIDSLVVGEGELPLQEFLRRWPNLGDHKIGSFWFKKSNGEIIKNKPEKLVEDFDSIPFPKFDLFDFENLMSSKSHSVIALITRGCPYRCTYCWNNYHASIYPKNCKYLRYRSASNAIEYLRRLKQIYPKVERFRFLDDILPAYKEWREGFKDQYIKDIHVPFTCNFRANFMDEPTAKFLKEVGCLYAFFGVESGNQEILDKVLKRALKKEVVLKAFRYCQKYKIKTAAYNIVGIPFETPEKVLETIKFNALLRPNHIFAMIYFPYPGTELNEMAVNAGFYHPDEPLQKYVNIKMPDFKPEEVLFASCFFREFKNMYMMAYIFPKPISKLLEKFIDYLYLAPWMPRKTMNKGKLKFKELREQFYFFVKTNFSPLYRFAQHMAGK